MCNSDTDVTHDDPRKRINVTGPGSGDRSRDTQCSSLKGIDHTFIHLTQEWVNGMQF